MADPQSLIGHPVQQYTIREHIARGGMADVYLAYEKDLERKVALKIMLPAFANDQQYVIRFQREARAVAQLDHPNIVQIYAIGLTDDGRPFIAMQYIGGGSLRDTLARVSQQGRLVDTRQSLSIIGKMADALQVAHRIGIVHRDVKPSNILIRPDGRPVLVDLGIASVEGGEKITHTGTLIGTPHYMSPEQASGKTVDARSDLYSLGVILYELLAGRRPFEAQTTMAVLHQHIYEQPPPLESFRTGLSPETVYLVHRCLRKNPDERFQTAASLRAAINQVIKAEGGTGMMTQAGDWQPYPTSEYRLSQSKILTPSGEEEPLPAEKGRGRWWLLAIIPFFVLACLGLLALMLLNPASPFAITAPLLTPEALAGGLVEAPLSTATSTSTPEPVSGAAETASPRPTVTAEEGLPAGEAEVTEPAPSPTLSPAATQAPTDTPQATPTATADPGPERLEIGRSVEGATIEGIRFGTGDAVVILVGGLHAGSAPATVALAERVITYFADNPHEIPASISLYIVPNANPDSPYAPGELAGRLNANDVDLNRNWDCVWTEDARFRDSLVPGSGGPAPFSEPETVALRDFILLLDPAVVIFWEARAEDGMSSPGACGARPQVSQRPAEIYGNAAGYEIFDFEQRTGQTLNGDGTNWIDGQGIPAIAVLLRDYENVDWDSNLAGVTAIIDYYAN